MDDEEVLSKTFSHGELCDQSTEVNSDQIKGLVCQVKEHLSKSTGNPWEE